MLLEDRVAVVTGAGRGIGRAIALALAAEGAHVVLAARSEDALRETAEGASKHGREPLVVPTDLTVPQQVEHLVVRTLERFSRCDVLVNNSGVGGPSGLLWELDPKDWDETFAVNVTGTFLCCRAFLPSMVERASGSIVIVGSMTGKRPLHGRTPYAASKLALVGLARTLAVETGPFGVRVNLVSPGAVAGPRIDWVIQQQASSRGISEDEARAEFEQGSPLGRLVDAGDVANAVVFLASDRSSAVTGEDMNVSAGSVMY